MIIALTSTTHTPGQLFYDLASNILQQRMSQLPGIGEVDVWGSALPAVRVEVEVPRRYFPQASGSRTSARRSPRPTPTSPKGAIEDDDFHYRIYANDQATKAAQYRNLVIAYRNGAAVRLSDVAEVVNSVEDLRNAGIVDAKPGIVVVAVASAGREHHRGRRAGEGGVAAIGRRVARRRRSLCRGRRSQTIRPSLGETERTLVISVFW